MGEWQTIDSAPKDGTLLVVVATTWAGEISGVETGPVRVHIAGYSGGKSDFAGDDWWYCDGGDAYATWCKPTHWMPISALPFP